MSQVDLGGATGFASAYQLDVDRGSQIMGHVNRKATRREMDHATQVIRKAFPGLESVFGGHSAYGGHRAPRDHTISFRLRDANGKYCSNVVWLAPEYLSFLTTDDVRALVSRANGNRRKRRGS